MARRGESTPPGTVAAARVTGFLGFLRAQRFAVGLPEALDGVRLAELAGALEEREIRLGLKALTCRNRDDWQRFDPLYDRYWHPRAAEAAEHQADAGADRRMPPAARGRGGYPGLSHSVDSEAGDPQPGESQAHRGGAGRHLALARTDFRLLVERSQMRLMEAQAELLARRVRRHRSRRYRDSARGRVVSLRRTLRWSLAHGGTPLQLAFRARRREPLKLVLLLDVSHSMAQYSFFLARFVRGLLLHLPRSQGFVFHTQLHWVTELFRQSDPETLRRRLQAMSQLWFGGTRIADSLRCFNDRHASRLLDSRTLVTVLSDGFDSDAPEALAAELRRLRRRVRRIAWLDPMIGRDGYVMDEANLLAAQPLLDYLGSARSLADLRAFGDYLARL